MTWCKIFFTVVWGRHSQPADQQKDKPSAPISQTIPQCNNPLDGLRTHEQVVGYGTAPWMPCYKKMAKESNQEISLRKMQSPWSKRTESNYLTV